MQLASSLRGRLALTLSRCPPAFWRIWALVLVTRCGSWVHAFLMLFLTTRRGLSVATAGLAMSAIGGGAVCASILGGQLSDRWGRRPTMLVSMFGGAAAVLALGRAERIGTILPAAFAFGIFADLYRPANSASVSDIVAPEHQREAFAHLYWAHNFGFAVAPSVAGLVMASFGFTPLLVVHALTLVACGIGTYFAIPESRVVREPITAQPTASGFSFGALRDKRLLLFLAAFAPGPLLMLQTVSVLPMLMQSDGIDAATYGRVIAINGLIIVLFQPWFVARILELPRTPVLVVGALCLGIGYGGHALADNPAEHILTLVFWTFGEIAIVPLAAGVVAELAPADQRGRYQGMYGLTWSFAQLASPWLATHVLASSGMHGWGIACTCLGALAAVLYVVFGARR